MKTIRPRDTERGAVLVHVTVALIVLIGFSAVAIDYGILWVSRGQAQNSADAGALAGAVSLAFDDFTNRSASGPATTAAIQAANANTVWGQAPDVTAGDVSYPTCPDGTSACVRVNVFRNQTRGNPLPVMAARLFNVADQGVRATATAEAAIANASDCLKPWAVPDKWAENYPVPQPPVPWQDSYTYDVADKKGNPLPNPDVYVRPTETSPGTGFTIENDYGTQLTLKPARPSDSIAPGWFFPVDLPRAGGGPITGGSRYENNIASCNGQAVPIGSTLQNEPGDMIGPTKHGMADLIALDPASYWDAAADGGRGAVAGGCMAARTCTVSPRLVALPIFDVAVYQAGKVSGRQDIVMVNILGFFIERMVGNDVVGRITHYPGLLMPGEHVSDPSAFSRTIVLVR